MNSGNWTLLRAATFCVAATAATAQELGTLSTASVRSDLEFNDNFDLRENSLGNALIWRNIFAYGFDSRTTADTLGFDARGTIRAGDYPGDIGTDVAADDPRLALTYARAVDDTSVSFSARYQRNDLDFFDPLSDVDDDGTFDPSGQQGTRESIRTNAAVNLNADGPLSFEGAVTYTQINFYDLSQAEEDDDGDFDDRERVAASGEFGFRVSPILTLTTGASYSTRLFTGGGVDNETRTADVGANARINPRLSSRVRIGYSEVISTRDGRDDTETGIVGSVNFAFDEINGETRFGFASTLNENGERYQVTVGKSITSDSTSLNGDIGLSTSADTPVRVIGNVQYSYSLFRTQFTANASQTAATNDNGDNVLNTFASLGVSRRLTRTSSLFAGVDAGLNRNESRDDENNYRVNFTASYSHDINTDWSWDVGYRGRYQETNSQDATTSNSVFAGVTRSFRATR